MHHGEDWWWKMNEIHDKLLEKLDAECCDDCITEQGDIEHEITVGNYTTTHFYMCGSAQKVMNANKDKKNVESLTRQQDELFKLEKEVMDDGEATEEQKVKARDLYNDIMRKCKI